MSAQASLRPLFEPPAVAIYGASSDATKIGGRPFDFLKNNGYVGALYPINPNRAEIQGLRAWPSEFRKTVNSLLPRSHKMSESAPRPDMSDSRLSSRWPAAKRERP